MADKNVMARWWFFDRVIRLIDFRTNKKRYYARIRCVRSWRVSRRWFRTATPAVEYGVRFCERVNRLAEKVTDESIR